MKRDGVARKARLKLRIVEEHGGYRGGEPAGELRLLLEKILIEGEGVTAHIRKIGLKRPLVGEARHYN